MEFGCQHQRKVIIYYYILYSSQGLLSSKRCGGAMFASFGSYSIGVGFNVLGTLSWQSSCWCGYSTTLHRIQPRSKLVLLIIALYSLRKPDSFIGRSNHLLLWQMISSRPSSNYILVYLFMTTSMMIG